MAVFQRDVAFRGPTFDRSHLSQPPDESSIDFARVVAVVVNVVAGGNDVVETQRLGKWRYKVIGRRGRQNQIVTLGSQRRQSSGCIGGH